MTKMKKHLKKYKYAYGFTLIELMVVVSIISVLSSTVLASVSSAREKATWVKVMQDIKNIQLALEQYKEDHGDYPPISSRRDASTRVELGVIYNFWGYVYLNSIGTLLQPYLSAMPYPPYPSTATSHYYYVKQSAGMGDLALNISTISAGTVGCVYIRNGYYLYGAWVNRPSYISTHDGGADPEAFEVAGGSVDMVSDPTGCHPGHIFINN